MPRVSTTITVVLCCFRVVYSLTIGWISEFGLLCKNSIKLSIAYPRERRKENDISIFP